LICSFYHLHCFFVFEFFCSLGVAVFVFGCVHSIVVALSCFRGFLLLNFLCEIFTQHLLSLHCAMGLFLWFQYCRCVHVSLCDFHGFCSIIASSASRVFLHYNHSYIVNFCASQMFLHYNRS
jgi:hypothetical protein